MGKAIYGFSDRDVPEVLDTFVRNGAVYKGVPPDGFPSPRVFYNRIWWATAKEEIAAATQGTAGTDFVTASGLAYLLKLNTTSEKLLKESQENGDWSERTIYNPFDTKIKVDTNVVFPVVQDRYSNFFVLDPPKYKLSCRFKLDEVLAFSDSSKIATIDHQWGYGYDHPSATITVYNLKTSTIGTYEFKGDTNDYGRATYDPQDDKWWIDIMECP